MADSYRDRLEAERAKYPDVEGNWPETVELNGKTFAVLYGFDGAGEIEGFALVDDEGDELFASEISVIYLIPEHIWGIIAWEFGEPYSFRIRTEKERQLYEEIRAEYNRLEGLKADG